MRLRALMIAVAAMALVLGVFRLDPWRASLAAAVGGVFAPAFAWIVVIHRIAFGDRIRVVDGMWILLRIAFLIFLVIYGCLYMTTLVIFSFVIVPSSVY